jgi:hypothetical protein
MGDPGWVEFCLYAKITLAQALLSSQGADDFSQRW